MSLPGIAETITLDSGEISAINITPNRDDIKNVTLELAQNNKLQKIQRHIRVFDHRVLYIKERIGKQARHILLELSLIDDKPVRVRDFNSAIFIAGSAIAILALVTFYIHTKGVLNIPDIFMYLGIGILGLASFACFVLTAKSYKNNWVFISTHGKVPVLCLDSNIPNKTVFEQFAKALMNNVALAKEANKKPNPEMLPAIVGEHRRLFEKGFITEEQFGQSKKNILSGN
jgi:hypothetical protein